MEIITEEPGSQLERFTRARSFEAERRISGIRIGDRAPVTFMADEVVVDAEDREAIDRMLASGGRIVRDVFDPELPDEFRRAGLGREVPLDMSGLPRSVKLRFDRPPEAGDVRLGAYLDRAELDTDVVRFSSESARRLTALIAPLRAEGRGVWMNEVGTDHKTLPLRALQEGAGLAYGSDPLTWGSMTGRFRIADAWQLIETLRLTRSGSGPVFIAICDSGFWFDAPTTPGSSGAQTIADLGTGLVRWNTVTDTAGIPSGPGRTNWHGTMAASAATARVGNAAGAAGSGGSVAVPCYFYDDRSADSAKTAMIRCAQFGIPLVNYSGTFTSVEFFFGTSAWNDTFNWAADNGVLMIASAGNNDISLPDDAVLRPATRTPRSLTVGATNDDGTKASFSNHGSSVGLWAPGVNVPVVPTGSSAMPPAGSFASGTSFSAPLVAGVAAMMRFANPALTVDQLRTMLTETGWPGAAGGGIGLDAYAAVWAAMAARMTESTTESAPERLFPRADGTFEPIFNTAVNRFGDTDDFLVDVGSFSRLEVSVQWYERLADISVFIESTDPARSDPDASVTRTSGGIVVGADVGSGTYRIRLRGTAPTAYLLSGGIERKTLASDLFENNDSFDTATRLRVQPRPAATWGIEQFTRSHGPGAFGLTLHTAAAAPNTTDQDFFVMDVPAEVGALRIPEVIVSSDEPIDVTLFDADRRPVQVETGVRTVTLRLGARGTRYVRVAGPTNTRYSLWVGLMLDFGALQRSWQEELQIVPRWWEDVHPERITQPEELRALVLDESVRDEQLVFGGATAVLPEGVRLDLLDVDGDVVRTAEPVAGRQVFDTRGLASGEYVLRIASPAAAPFELIAQPPIALTRG